MDTQGSIAMFGKNISGSWGLKITSELHRILPWKATEWLHHHYALVSMLPPFKTDQYWHTHTHNPNPNPNTKTKIKNTNCLICLNEASAGSARTYFASLDFSSVKRCCVNSLTAAARIYPTPVLGGGRFLCNVSGNFELRCGGDGGDGYPTGPTLFSFHGKL